MERSFMNETRLYESIEKESLSVGVGVEEQKFSENLS